MQTLSAVLPVILLVLLGLLLQRIKLISAETVSDLQKIVVNITLPLLLFKAFATMTFEPRYFLIVAVVFLSCVLILAASFRLRFLPGLKPVFSPFLMAGFEAGMLGYAMFAAVFGVENVPYFAVIDLGQVLFVFFILVTRLEVFEGGKFDLKNAFMKFLKTPVIIGILAGGVANFFGLYWIISGIALTESILRTMEILAGLTTPLVAIVIGYGLHFQKGNLTEPVKTVALRLFVWVSLAILFNTLVIHQLMGLDRLFEAAVLLMAVLPAPFVVPFYLSEKSSGDKDYILNTLSIGTLAALAGGIIIRVIY